MNNLKAIITVGVSGSGKSTYAKELCKEYNWFNIERDVIREFIMVTQFHFPSSGDFVMVDNLWKHWKFKNESLVNAEFDLNILRAVNNKFNIVISNTNLNKYHRDALKLKLEALGYEVEIKVFGLDLTFEELCKRDLWRKNSVGYTIIAKQYEQFRKEFPKYTLKDVSNKPNILICDIDGTAAIMCDRSPYSWDKVKYDIHNEVVFSFLEGFCSHSIHVNQIQPKIIFMSGRDSVCRADTIQWIDAWCYRNSGFDYELYMRKEGDMRKDTIVKEELFFENVDGKYNVQGVLDDRNCVVRLWMDMQFKVYHCGNAWIDF